MRVIGLTGSIGMGKSTTANLFRTAGLPVHDADQTVHDLYGGSAAPLVEAAFVGCVKDGVVDRAALSARVMGDDAAIRKLETIIHPLVRAERDKFIQRAATRNAQAIVLDIPLLFETGGDRDCDLIVVVTVSADIQKARVLARDGMTEARFAAILARQMPDAEKRRRAHFCIDTGKGIASAERQVQDVLRATCGMQGHKWQAR